MNITLDCAFPVFALVFCVINKQEYFSKLVPVVQKLKFDFWGHDQVILHEHDIRKEKGYFAELRTSKAKRELFMEQLSVIMADAPVQIITAIIDKQKLLSKYADPFNPYELALRFCMERALSYLIRQGEEGKQVHVLLESRGKKENAELELEFRRICDNECRWQYSKVDFQKIKFEHLFVEKASNSTGLQIADLVARPIALQYLRPDQPNRAYDIVKEKILSRIQFP
ncbi:MAG: DUF3800 domain-containing protein [Chlorobium sp.]|nr:MAG: DUF3800 domain-containing protein [Chlorobium sp.]